MQTIAIIPAAGSGVRMGGDRAKQFLDMGGKPLLTATLEALEACSLLEAMILVVPEQEMQYCREDIVARSGLKKIQQVVKGGRTRQDSVRLGLEAAGSGYTHALIHDGVRPFIDGSLLENVLQEARESRAVITGLPAVDTVKELNERSEVVKTHKREQIWLVQTPQVFRFEDILKAHKRAVEERWEGVTDDAFLVEKLGISVKMIMGSRRNIKITTPHDLELARSFLAIP